MHLPAHHRALIRSALPVALVGVGVTLLVGCFTVPATRQFQTNGNRLPETRIADEGDDKIILGQTLIEEAIARITDQIGFEQVSAMGMVGSVRHVSEPGMKWADWVIDDAGRQFAIHYSVRTGTDVYPLCFDSAPRSKMYFFILKTDEQRRVISAEAVEATKRPEWLRRPRSPKPRQWLELFDEQQRKTLHDAGVLPDDELLNRMGNAWEHPTRARAPNES